MKRSSEVFNKSETSKRLRLYSSESSCEEVASCSSDSLSIIEIPCESHISYSSCDSSCEEVFSSSSESRGDTNPCINLSLESSCESSSYIENPFESLSSGSSCEEVSSFKSVIESPCKSLMEAFTPKEHQMPRRDSSGGSSGEVPSCSFQPLSDDEDSSPFTPREYQIELLEAALKHNIIACLGTGTGKTFIAVLLIRELQHYATIPFEEGGKRIFFLVPTVPLVTQQGDVIARHTELKVGTYFGEMDVDAWSKEEWERQFCKNEVLVMTAEIFRIILDHSFLPVSRVCLLVFDECHRAHGKDPYAEIMNHLNDYKSKYGSADLPKIFGLTASLVNSKIKPSNLESNLAELEGTLTCVIETASDYVAVQRYGTDPQEYIAVYRDNEELTGSVAETKLSTKLKECSLKLYKTSEFRNEDNVDEVVFFKKPAHCLNQLFEILSTFGVWCTGCAAEAYLKDVDRLVIKTKTTEDIALLNDVKSALGLCVEYYKNADFSVDNLPSKLARFLEIFEAVKKGCVDTTENSVPVCIVFVEKRIIAYVLSQWLNKVAQLRPDLSFIKANFIVGHGGSVYSSNSKEFAMNVEKQKKIVKSFRDKEFNVLIATSVVEEGMDIQKCNMVVRFDLPKNFTSYIQSKGRARAANSKYVMLVSSIDFPLLKMDLCNYKSVEKYLLKECHDRDELTEEERIMLETDLLPPYQPTTPAGNPRITMSSAISIVNRYCAKLPSDMATKLAPRWVVDTLQSENEVTKYVCTLWLPINSPLRQSVAGVPMPQKKFAKMAAALKACELLHNIGELNDHLLPESKAIEVACEKLDIPEKETTEDGSIPGTNKRRQLYEKKVADILTRKVSVGNHYLHVIVMNLVIPLAKSLNPRNRPLVNPAYSLIDFGILTTERLPKLPIFPIFTKVGKIQISIHNVKKPVYLSEDDLGNIEMFHEFLFSDILYLNKDNMVFCPDLSRFSSLIVPVKTDDQSLEKSLDFEYIKYCMVHSYHQQMQDPSCLKHVKPQFEKYHNAVVTRKYCLDPGSEEIPVFHYVNKIHHDLNPCSKFTDDTYGTFKDFYKGKYNIDIVHNDQFLLEVERCQSFNLTKPRYISVKTRIGEKTTSKRQLLKKNFREYLVPELSIVHPFNGDIYRKAAYLPSIMYRLNQLLVAENLRSAVADAEHIGKVSVPMDFQWPVLNFESSDKKLRKMLVKLGEIKEENYTCFKNLVDIVKHLRSNDILSFESDHDPCESPDPNPGCLLQALTTKSGDDEFDLERLESIGDSFLKYAMSVKLYSSFPTFDEGKLTRLRSLLICNLNLYQKSKQKHLPECMMHTPFNSRQSWLPPGYIVDEIISTKLVRTEKNKPLSKIYRQIDDAVEEHDAAYKMYNYQLVSDKNVADAVEALIGVYLLSCGQKGALGFMNWIGLDPYVVSENKEQQVKVWPPIPQNPRINTSQEPAFLQRCEKYFNSFDNFQGRIRYKFKEPAYLFQAFTHPSYDFNQLTDCFQRLEFLGDAVLDYLVTRKLFDDPAEHSPGKLTDLRSALVNNTYFASLAVKYGYHKNIKTLTIALEKQIDEFVQKLKNTESFRFFEVYGYYFEEKECFELEEVEVPKILGDLFESVAGAIYLDNGSSLDAVWKIYYPMMKPAIDHLSQHVPVSVVRQLYEIDNHAEFKVEESASEKTIISLTLSSGKVFQGIGPNKKTAKKSAAKRALLQLKCKQNEIANTRSAF